MTRITLGKPISINGITIIPIEKTSVESYGLGPARWAHGIKEPVAVVVKDASGVRAFDMEGRLVALEEVLGGNEGIHVGGLISFESMHASQIYVFQHSAM
jgi:hypothetical protein